MGTVWLFGPCRLDTVTHRFVRDDREVHLRSKTFAVLQYLVENPMRLVTTAELVRELWAGAAVSPGLLRTYVKELRSALGDDPRAPRYVETVAGRGYRFVGAVLQLTDPPVTDDPVTRVRNVPREDLPFDVLRNQLQHALGHAQYAQAEDIADALEIAARRAADPAQLAFALASRGGPLLCRGSLLFARHLFERALEECAPGDRPLGVAESAVACMAAVQLGALECMLGAVHRGLRRVEWAVNVARDAGSPSDQAMALGCLANVHYMRRESEAALAAADQAGDVAREYWLPFWRDDSALLRRWALVVAGDESGLASLEEAVEARVRAFAMGGSFVWLVAAEARKRVGDVGGALDAVQKALDFVREHDEHAWESEALRLQAELIAVTSGNENISQAQALAMRALECARLRSARLYELRAGVTLLSLASGSTFEYAQAVVRTVLDSMSEGAGLEDIVHAQSVLAQAQTGERRRA